MNINAREYYYTKVNPKRTGSYVIHEAIIKAMEEYHQAKLKELEDKWDLKEQSDNTGQLPNSIEGIFIIDLEGHYKMKQDEFVEKTKIVLNKIANTYSQAWQSRLLEDNEYPDESICDKCTGCGTFKINEEIKECFQDKEQGQCYHRFCDYEQVGKELEDYIEDVFELISVDEVINTGQLPSDKNWVCNECNTPNFTQSVPQEEIEQELHSCINCGGFEFHLRDAGKEVESSCSTCKYSDTAGWNKICQFCTTSFGEKKFQEWKPKTPEK